MVEDDGNRFSGPISVFKGRRLPVTAIPAGYAALIGAYHLQVPFPRVLSATGERHKLILEDGWRVMSPRHAPKASLEGHLTFALKYEGLDLVILKRLFLAAGPMAIEKLVRAQPTGRYARRIWFLYEWLIGNRLDLPDAGHSAYVSVVDPERQFAIQPVISKRHRVKNNLPGTPDFCPMVFRTKTLDYFTELDLETRARDAVRVYSKDLLARTAAFLLLKDSRASFAIEGEHPSHSRIQPWNLATGEAGRQPIEHDDLLRLQRIVIGDARFIRLGLRSEGGFVGDRDRATAIPIPHHISARPEDLTRLVEGLVAFDRQSEMQLDPVVAASMLAFGFVYIHPFEDGNGRLHRYLIHHVLSRRGFSPLGLVFPISAVMLDRIDAYRAALEDYSKRLLPVIDWRSTGDGNVEVLNDTGDFYRFFDATAQAEFIYGCVERTIERDFPQEALFLERYDRFRAELNLLINMPDRLSDLLFRFLHQNEGRLSGRGRTNEFAALTDCEVSHIESKYQEIFD